MVSVELFVVGEFLQILGCQCDSVPPITDEFLWQFTKANIHQITHHVENKARLKTHKTQDLT